MATPAPIGTRYRPAPHPSRDRDVGGSSRRAGLRWRRRCPGVARAIPTPRPGGGGHHLSPTVTRPDDRRFPKQEALRGTTLDRTRAPPCPIRLDRPRPRRRAGRGPWAGSSSPTSTVSAAGCIRISAVRFNASGDDNKNLNDEWVRVSNVCSSMISVGGWWIKDRHGQQVHLRELGPNGQGIHLPAHRQGHQSTRPPLLGPDQSEVWNNSGIETAYLVNKYGKVVSNVTRNMSYDADVVRRRPVPGPSPSGHGRTPARSACATAAISPSPIGPSAISARTSSRSDCRTATTSRSRRSTSSTSPRASTRSIRPTSRSSTRATRTSSARMSVTAIRAAISSSSTGSTAA